MEPSEMASGVVAVPGTACGTDVCMVAYFQLRSARRSIGLDRHLEPPAYCGTTPFF
jgi:hypothetical protein